MNSLRKKPPVVLLFGESSNDTHAISHLIESIRPDLPPTKPLRRPLVLSISAAREKRRSVADEISSLCKALSATNRVVAVVAHRDCDDIEPAHKRVSETLVSDLRAAGVPQPICASPAFEIEAWWLLWPDACASVRNCWRRVNINGRDVGQIRDAKEYLTRALRPKGSVSRCPDYSESDGIKIAKAVKDGKLLSKPAAVSASFQSFREQILSIKL